MKCSSKYVGLHVYQATTVSTVRDDSGRVLARGVVPTEAIVLVEHVRSMRGAIHVAFEEGTRAQWLHDLLAPLAHQIIVCDRRGQIQQGNEGDQSDAGELSVLEAHAKPAQSSDRSPPSTIVRPLSG